MTQLIQAQQTQQILNNIEASLRAVDGNHYAQLDEKQTLRVELEWTNIGSGISQIDRVVALRRIGGGVPDYYPIVLFELPMPPGPAERVTDYAVFDFDAIRAAHGYDMKGHWDLEVTLGALNDSRDAFIDVHDSLVVADAVQIVASGIGELLYVNLTVTF